jgi:small subunit ribosomal protein S17
MNTRRRITGFVTSNKMDKTVIVEITRTYRHRLYKKVVHSQRRLMAHDELGCQIGDQVRIVESRPISRHKRWVVEEILRRMEHREDVEDEIIEPEELKSEAVESEEIEVEELQ